VIVAKVHPALIGPDVELPVGNGFAYLSVGEVVHVYPGGGSFGIRLGSDIGVVADAFLYLTVNREHGLADRKVQRRLGGDVVELGAAVAVLLIPDAATPAWPQTSRYLPHRNRPQRPLSLVREPLRQDENAPQSLLAEIHTPTLNRSTSYGAPIPLSRGILCRPRS
jgi:hypothetical protein